MNKIKVVEVLKNTSETLGILESVASMEGKKGWAEGMHIIRKDINDLCTLIEGSSEMVFPKEAGDENLG